MKNNLLKNYLSLLKPEILISFNLIYLKYVNYSQKELPKHYNIKNVIMK